MDLKYTRVRHVLGLFRAGLLSELFVFLAPVKFILTASTPGTLLSIFIVILLCFVLVFRGVIYGSR